MSEQAQPLLEARGLTKRYGHVHALDGADFTVYRGEIVALVGDNGAGKSTLVKALVGTIAPDAGDMYVEGRPVRLNSPAEAQRLGIETVYQDLALAAELDAASNLYLGREIRRTGPLGAFGVLDKATMRQAATKSFGELGIELPDVSAPVRTLSGGQRQCVAVARAVSWATKVVFMDEPTAALGVLQRQQVLDVIRRVRAAGVTVVLISHNMPEVLEISDRVEVLRLGRRVARFSTADTSMEQLVSAMTGGVTTEEAA